MGLAPHGLDTVHSCYVFLICSFDCDLISRSHPTEGVFMRRMRTGRDAAPAGSASSAGPPGASGDTARPNYVGPSGNGLVERMKAGENPRNQGRCEWAPLSVSRRRSRGLRKTPQWSAERRAGPRHGPAIPSAGGTGSPQGGPTGAAFRAREFRRSASLIWECEGFETDNLARQSAGMRRAATLPHGSTNVWRRNHDAEICAPNSPPSCPALCRASTPWRKVRRGWPGQARP